MFMTLVLLVLLVAVTSASIASGRLGRLVPKAMVPQRHWYGRMCMGQVLPRGFKSSKSPITTGIPLPLTASGAMWSDMSNVVLTPMAGSSSNVVFQVTVSGTDIPVAVFKPDFGENSNVMLPLTIKKGDASLKERFAYILGEYLGANVPYTEVVTVDGHSGSLQEFVHGDTRPTLSTSELYAYSNPRDVRALAVLDLMLVSLDRHQGNKLRLPDGSGSFRIWGIDNGWCLPSVHDLDLGDMFTPELTRLKGGFTCYPSLTESVDPELLDRIINMPVYALAKSAADCGIDAQYVNTFILSAEYVKTVLGQYPSATIGDLYKLRMQYFDGDLQLISSAMLGSSTELMSEEEYLMESQRFRQLLTDKDIDLPPR